MVFTLSLWLLAKWANCCTASSNFIFVTPLDTQLTIDDLFDVHDKLINARTKWYNIGLFLKVDSETLKSIERLSQDDNERLREMLDRCLHSGGCLTWKVLCECLRSRTVSYNDVAKEIEETIGKKFHGALAMQGRVVCVPYQGFRLLMWSLPSHCIAIVVHILTLADQISLCHHFTPCVSTILIESYQM